MFRPVAAVLEFVGLVNPAEAKADHDYAAAMSECLRRLRIAECQFNEALTPEVSEMGLRNLESATAELCHIIRMAKAEHLIPLRTREENDIKHHYLMRHISSPH